MYKTIGFILVIALLNLTACTGPSKTKENLFEAGVKAVQEKDPGTAIIHFKNALEKDPNYVDARMELGRAYSSIGKYDSAQKELRKVLLQRPGFKEAHVELARAYVLSGKPDQALDEIETARLDLEHNVDVMEIRGWAYALNSNHQTAIALLKKALALQPDRLTTRLSLARVYALGKSREAARAQISDILKKDPSNRGALYLLAEIQTQEKDTEGALKTYDHIIQNSPAESMAFFRKGMILVRMGRTDDALSISETLMKGSSGVSEGYELKGIALFYKKQYPDAVAAFQKAVSLRPGTNAYYLLGLSLFYTGEFEQSMTHLRLALELNPSMAQARIVSSLIYLKKKKLDEAIAEIKKALALDDRNPLSHSILGSAYLSKGMSTEGMVELNRALEIDPGFIQARVKKGILHLAKGKTGEAETELRTAVLANPELLNTRVLLASYYLKQGEIGKAIATAREGIRGERTDAVLYNIIADGCLRERKKDEAVQILMKAKGADPGYGPSYYKLAALHQLAGEQEKGIAELKTFAEYAPGNVQAQLAFASVLETTGNNKEARIYYERARRTGTTEGAFETANYYLRTNEFYKAVAVLDESLRKDPFASALYALKGQAYLAQKKFEDAVLTYEQLAKMMPEEGLGGIINAYVAANKPEKALDRVRNEMKRDPEHRDLHAAVSRLYVKMGKTSEAIENARRMIQRRPGSPDGYMVLAMVYQSARQTEKGIEVLAKAPRINDVNMIMMLGNLYAARKNYSGALAQYKKAESMKGQYVPAIFQKAVVFQAMGKKNEAIAEYQRVLKLARNHIPALNNLAYLYAEERTMHAAALQYAVQAYSLAPNDGSVQDTLGFLLLKNGRANAGLKALKRAASTLSDNPSIYYHLALALKENNNPGEAVSYLEKALNLGDFPEYRQAKILLADLKGEVR